MEDELAERYGISLTELLHMASKGKTRDGEARLKVAETQIRPYGNEADSNAANAQRIVAGNSTQTTSQGLQASRRQATSVGTELVRTAHVAARHSSGPLT